MNQPIQDLSNAREKQQQEIMEELAQTGECFLCLPVITRIVTKYPNVSSAPLYEGNYWFIKNNDFPYKGTELHILIVPKRHVTKIEDLSIEEFLELKNMIGFVNMKYGVRGASLFVRYGDMSYTGATLSHIHFHLIHGIAKHADSEAIKPTLGYRE